MAVAAQGRQAVTFHIATSGNDQNPGTETKPFATLPRAQQAVRELKASGNLNEPVTVYVHWLGLGLSAQHQPGQSHRVQPYPKDKSGPATLTNTFECNWNLYFNPTQKLEEVKYAGGTWTEWQQRGKDARSIIKWASPRSVFHQIASAPRLSPSFRRDRKRGHTAHSKGFARFTATSPVAKRLRCGASRRFGSQKSEKDLRRLFGCRDFEFRTNGQALVG